MLPFILGGVAIAAVGYGLKKYCDENDCYETLNSYTESAFDIMEKKVDDIYETLSNAIDTFATKHDSKNTPQIEFKNQEIKEVS